MKTNIFKDFAKYTSLNVLGMIALSCYILADTFFIAMGLGANGLAALNFAIPVYGIIHGSGLMLGIGGATKYSISKSRNETGKANRTFTNTILIMLVFSAAFFAAGLFFSAALTRMLGVNDEIFIMSKTYIQIILLFSPIFILNNVLLCFIRNDGAPKLAMIAMLSSSGANIILDYIFIILLGKGMFGAAITTGFSAVLGMLVLSYFFLKKRNRFHLVKCGISGRLSRRIFSNGLPSFITEASSGVVIIVFNIIILRLQGNIGVAAYGVIANLSLVVIAIFTGIAQGIQPIISSNFGIGNHSAVKAILRYALILLVILSAIIYLSVFFGAPHIASAFNSEQNPHLQTAVISGIKIYFTACLFAGFNIIMSVYFTSTERPRPAQIISILRGFLLIIPIVFLLSSAKGITGVWSAFPISEFIVAVVAVVLWRRRK